MRSGGVVVASDLPVHREVYQEAASYCATYSPEEFAAAIVALDEPAGAGSRGALLTAGQRVAERYAPTRILPQWESFISSVCGVGT
jgi:hypothetical protein